MAITLTANARNAACDGIVDLVDAGAGAGTLEIKSAASTVAGTSEVATLTFADPSFGAAAAGTAALASAMTSDTNATGGTAGFYTVFDSNSVAVWQGTVATSGADLNLSSTTIGAGDTVTVSAFTLTVPASPA
jgi:hypothetical protein